MKNLSGWDIEDIKEALEESDEPEALTILNNEDLLANYIESLNNKIQDELDYIAEGFTPEED